MKLPDDIRAFADVLEWYADFLGLSTEERARACVELSAALVHDICKTYETSLADGEACTDRGPAAEEGPAPVISAAGAGHPNITRTELQCAAFAVREYGDQCTTEFGRKYWVDIADKLNAAAAAKK